MTKYLIVALWVLGCTTPDTVGENPDGPVVVPTQDDTEVEVITDAGIEVRTRSYAEIELCSVIVTFTFIGDRATNVEFENNNDATVIVTVEDETTGGMVVENCLWPDNIDGEEVDFAKSDSLSVTVYLGEGQFFQYTCLELIDEVLNIFDFCREQEVSFG